VKGIYICRKCWSENEEKIECCKNPKIEYQLILFNNQKEKMIYKSKNYNWQWQEISMEINWIVRTKIEDPVQASWFRDSKIIFKDWNETKGPDNLNLPKLYLDIFPEFTKMVDGRIRLRKARAEEMFPWTVFNFKLMAEDIYVPKVKEKMWKMDAEMLLQIKKDLKAEIIEEIREDLIKDIVAELSGKDQKIIDNYLIPKIHKLIQKDRLWKVIWSFLNASHAAEITGVSRSSISQNIKWKTKRAWGCFWSLNNS